MVSIIEASEPTVFEPKNKTFYSRRGIYKLIPLIFKVKSFHSRRGIYKLIPLIFKVKSFHSRSLKDIEK
ncbi:hypothetical protein DAPPUDRAFT_237598 [Daphnia pulex]|uniref:Uncharacterized protein n=1 Tax=Daphnia pulex TaxID=6669 RepID=E9G5B6_DAPPU|nr:hypothetical protein DAPPUDRAFT_249871 [Daphnia pulex]EFX85660.1 hypothetical protein DAPPUDRAFT_237598 [Daphnia pulex]|eukprot:EFX75857.1 hypothetical protein DAPPUDRAFT_249871 [Daphnia pulex]